MVVSESRKNCKGRRLLRDFCGLFNSGSGYAPFIGKTNRGTTPPSTELASERGSDPKTIYLGIIFRGD
jgi:hypothetical protein